MPQSRYIIGIDLGTSNSSLSYIDTLAEDVSSEVLPVPQLVSPGVVQENSVLPSFLYLGTEEEKNSGELALDSEEDAVSNAVGRYALEQTALLPGRVIASAKSWLCHEGVDREEGILPWGSEDISAEERLSPVEVSSRYLRHFLEAWNNSLGAFEDEYRFEKQEVIITVPASFDEAAQQLTLAAAQLAGYPPGVRLLEEPQAALYRWMEEHRVAEMAAACEVDGEQPLSILVCDIGGGTTDFSLFHVSSEKDGSEGASIARVAVSDHILLGGDNIDLTLAHCFEQKLLPPGEDDDVERKLSARAWNHLVFAARNLKERVFSEDEAEAEQEYHVSVPGDGSSLFAKALSASISREEVLRLIVDGFFPFCDSKARPERSTAALTEWGLPFARDSRVSHHLAAFLEDRKVDAVLFNGGTLVPTSLRKRLLEIIASWQGASSPKELSSEEMSFAVARGAACFAYAFRGHRQKIHAGYARSIYLELYRENPEDTPELICILAQGFEATHAVDLSELHFKLLVDQPVRFQLYHSVHRGEDCVGQIIDYNEYDFHSLPPLQTLLTLPKGLERPQDGMLDIQLEASVSELGLLQIFCVSKEDAESPNRWQLEFNLRKSESEAQSRSEKEDGPMDTGVSKEKLAQACTKISLYYGKKKSIEGKLSPKKLLGEIEELFKCGRADWNTALLRALWPTLLKGITRRGRSLAHETTWLYLAGFILRPGYGAELDQFRMNELWRCYELGLSFTKENSARTQWWIMWRRVAGGLDSAQQNLLFNKALHQAQKKGQDDPELFRMVGSLERVSLDKKVSLGNSLVKRISGRRSSGIEHHIWALGRLASRIPLYGSAHQVVPPEHVAAWFEKLSQLDWTKGDYSVLNTAFSQACRNTGDRQRDVSPEVRKRVAQKMLQSKASEEQRKVVEEIVEIDLADQIRLFGEELPAGLHLVKSVHSLKQLEEI